MKTTIKIRLCTMMFLEFFIWGGWFVTMGSYLAANLHASGVQTGLAYSTQSWGAIIAPFIVGLIADRYFNAERLLGIFHLAGGVLMYALYSTRDFAAFYPFLFAYMILYMPTLALVNAISFRQMDEPARHFSAVRVWGTIGWIVAGLVISYLFAWDSKRRHLAGPAARYVPHVRARILRARPVQLHPAADAAAPRVRRAAESRAPRGVRCPGAAAREKLRRVLRRFHPHLHTAGVLLPERQPVPDRDPRRQRHRQADPRPDVGSAVHAADPAVPAHARHEDHAPARHAGVGLPLRAVRLRQRAGSVPSC